MDNRIATVASFSQLSTIDQQRLEILVNVDRLPDKSQVKRSQCSQVLIAIILCQSCNVLDHNLLSGLELEQLEDQADKLCWLLNSILTTDRIQLVRFFDNRRLS